MRNGISRTRGDGLPVPRINVVVTCTHRKTRAPELETCARMLTHGTLKDRLSAWISALSHPNLERIPAEQLYAGDHWQVALSLNGSVPSGLAVRTWVCSAGLGLIRLDTPICSYSATFDSGHADFVGHPKSSYDTADWWNALAEWSPAGTHHRTITSLVEDAASSGESVILALSQAYLRAVRDDLAAAVRISNSHVAILCVGIRPGTLCRILPNSPNIPSLLLPAHSRMKPLVGGAMQSLNVRLLRWALTVADQWVHDPGRLARLLEEWGTSAPDLPQYDRSRSDDRTIKDYIRSARRTDASVKHTTLLRALRESGHACEQTRFRALFHDVAAEGLATEETFGGEIAS